MPNDAHPLGTRPAAFATDDATASYYERRAAEYDEWYTGEGLYAERDRPGWTDELAGLIDLARQLTPMRTLDVACGTGFLTRHLRGYVVGLDQSRSMVAIAQARLPEGLAIVGDALDLVVADQSFGRVFTSHFYGHLPPGERRRFLREARRVAGQLVVVDSAKRTDVEAEQWQERVLKDGSRHRVFKRYLTANQLADEIGGEPLLSGDWFVAAQASWS